MKKVFASLLIALFAILIASCESQSKRNAKMKAEQQQVDKIVKQVADEINNPVFKDSEGFINDILTNREHQRYTTIVNRLTLSEINEMAKVVIHREGYIDWKLFLKEYDQSYQRVYQYLNEPNNTPPISKSDTIFKVGSKNNNLNVTKDGTTNVSSNVHGK